ncbi:intraflagellar transport protein, putative [Ichthyophthirius multifiliis]|uniref:Intraflagellar transport protein, putative n=1 Tax=Ichthyophthirius multifiliis TaxID=5932 RepID=G0QV09_ICHMU|nr:intraflagellar transport protein, putative [Ichthyophthirius multifiliis]EGR30951.1 intraflagellar transport protein, putative [Ichthyophthirius multifiliis]|eukprot:XP_004032538.1 intraflagellar transport protein, putative [Ichthyophthirius multifiliis]
MSDSQFQSEQATAEDATVYMEEILEKLKLLNYEKSFIQQNGLKPLNRAYFAVPLNSNEQFNYFNKIVTWLFKQNNVDGSGETACKVILDLTNRALKTKGFSFKKHKIDQPSQTAQEEAIIDDGADDEADMAENISVESEEDFDVMGDIKQAKQEIDEDKQVIQSKINEKDWILEVERVTAKLRYQIKNDAKEWRSHIEQTKEFSSSIKKILPEARPKLERLIDHLSKVLEQISKREKNINQNMTDLGGEYRTKSENYKTIVTQYNNLQNSIKEQGEQYKQLKEKYDAIKIQLESKGDEQTNSSPVIKIKEAIKKIRQEIGQMDVRIGIISQTVLQHKLRQKQSGIEEDAENLDEIENEQKNQEEELDF